MASKYDDESDDEVGGLLAHLKDLALRPFRLVFSKSAQRAYLTTFLVVSTALLLLGVAFAAYVLFYWNYIPRIGFERTIHLQFDNVFSRHPEREAHPYPYGFIALKPDIVSDQPYDVKIELSMPRTPANKEVGNFMVEVDMLAPDEQNVIVRSTGQTLYSVSDGIVLAQSRRPAILPYRSTVVDAAYRLSELHWYILGFRSEVDKLVIDMFEKVQFARGFYSTPAYLKLELQSTHAIQVYGAKAIFRARFEGLRWLMYNYRVISAFVFTSAFWTTELFFAGLAWAIISFMFAKPDKEVKAEQLHEAAEQVKRENEDEDKSVLSDTERTFPTTSRQLPLRYSPPNVKQEGGDEPTVLPENMSRGVDADDEDEDADVFQDSGIGTSMDSSATRRDSVRKRRGRPSSRPDG